MSFLDIFTLNLNDDDDYYDEHAEDKQHEPSEPPFPPIVHTLLEALHHIAQPIERTVSDYESNREETQEKEDYPNYFLVTYLRFIKNTIHNQMGNMAQCRINSTHIREGGGIQSLMMILHTMIHAYLPMVEIKVQMVLDTKIKEQLDGDGDGVTCSNGYIADLEKDQASFTSSTNSISTSTSTCSQILLEEVYGVTIAALGALRDLACGNAQNRLLVGQFTYIHSTLDKISPKGALGADADTNIDIDTVTGIEIISHFVQKHDGASWEEIASLPHRRLSDHDHATDSIDRWELKTMTNALGVIRNISHSTPFNCQGLHQVGMTLSLIHRLLCVNVNANSGDETDGNCAGNRMHGKSEGEGDSSCSYRYTYTLPDVTKPWREACYRSSGSLINMAERCHDVAVECGERDDGGALILILIQSWGGFDLDQMLSTCSGIMSLDNDNGTGSNNNGEDKIIASSGKSKGKKGKKACPVLHVGLWNILNVRIGKEKEMDFNVTNKMAVDGIDLMAIIRTILEREEKRKQTAQARENARKKAKQS